ncbi:MAG: ABC transporter permease [Bryobacteraceae bacterium]
MRFILQDAQFGVRMLRKNPGYTLIAMAALALGIGANTAIFSVVNAALLRPLPFADPDRLVFVCTKATGAAQEAADAVSSFEYLDYREQAQVFTNLAALTGIGLDITAEDILQGSQGPEYVPSGDVSYNFFETLGWKPLLGHTFVLADEDPDLARVVVLSYDLWKSHFGGDPNIVGKSVPISGTARTVIGVMPAGLQFPPKAQLWMPYSFGHDRSIHLRYFRAMQPIGRLRDGLTLRQAQADADLISAQMAQRYPGLNRGRRIVLIPIREMLTGDIRPSLLILLTAAGFVLLIACTNVANLQLARASTRRKEMAIRTALGAGRGQVTRQLLTESTILALIGGLLGLGLAYVGLRLLVALSPADLATAAGGTLDPTVLAFTFVVSIGTGILFGLAPASETAKVNLTDTLKEGGRSSASGKHQLRRLLVVAEIAMCLVLLVGAGLMLESFSRLEDVKPGFNPDRVLTMMTAFGVKYPNRTPISRFCSQLLSRVSALPGVKSTGIVYLLPLGGAAVNQFFTIDGRGNRNQRFSADLHWVSSGALETLQVPLLRGRLFTHREGMEMSNVVLISAEMARRYFPGEDPIGKRIDLGEDTPAEHRHQEIVGVVGNVQHRALDSEPYPAMYRPNLGLRWSYLLVRTAGDPRNLIPAVREQFRAVDPEQPVTDIKLLDDVVQDSVARPRFRTLLLALFAAVALTLATVGIYGVVAYSVSQRRHDIGIRLAMGAQPRDVLHLILRQGLTLAVLGLAAGIPVSLVLARFLSGFLFEVSPFSPLMYGAIALLLTGVALLASYIPARRATRVDPIAVLRQE